MTDTTLTAALTFADLRAANEASQAHWGGTDNWTLADWSNAVAGEVGEACNIVKKIRRPELGTTGNSEDVTAYYPKLESEIGDVLIYLDLLAKKAGTTLDRAVSRAFNEKSAALDMPVRLEALARSSTSSGDVGVKVAELDDYDAGLLNDYGGGDTDWWLDYIRAEIGRANDFWREQLSALSTPALAPQPSSAGVGDVSEERGWLCEWIDGQPKWATVDDENPFTADSLLAIRFARREDAQAYIESVGWNTVDPVEHMWVGPASSPPPKAATTAKAGEIDEMDDVEFVRDRTEENPTVGKATTAKVGEITDAQVEKAIAVVLSHDRFRVNFTAMRAALTAAQLSPVSAPDELLVAALRGLVLCKDLFDGSDRTQADAYYILAKQDGVWGNARSAIASLNIVSEG